MNDDAMTDRIRPEEITVLIPAAGRVPGEPIGSVGAGCPAMIPVGGRPVIYWTLNYLQQLGLRNFIIAVAERGLYVEEYVRYLAAADCRIRFVQPAIDGGLGRTVLELAEAASTRAALVVLGDTYFQFDDPTLLRRDEPTVLVHPVDDSQRWCVARTDAAGYVTSLHDKEPNLGEAPTALVGAYYLPDVVALRSAAREAAAAATGKIEFSQILRRLGERRPLRARPVEVWRDCGNPDLQVGSHLKLLESRAFNHLSVDPLLGVIRKHSERGDKLIDEINYLRMLPPDLAVLFPRVVDFSIAPHDPWLRMEYFGFPTLAEVFLYEHLSGHAWRRVFRRLHALVRNCFMQWPRKIDAESIAAMYLTKPRARLQSLAGPPELLKLIQAEQVTVNGRRLAGLDRLWNQIEDRTAALGRNCRGSVIHGDLCLSNILYDWRSDVCKLIDPRGSFGSSGIYGDPRYDVAKLYHSVYGGYDFIVHDLFDAAIDGDGVAVRHGRAPQHDEVRRRFEEVFFADFDREEILLLTGLLFVSMPALHYDHPRRQIAMYVRGLELLNEVFHPTERD